MSGLVERVREKVRSRSISRKRRSSARNKEDERQSTNYADGRASQELLNTNSGRVSSPNTASWHVHKGVRDSTDEPPPQQSQPPVSQFDQRNMADAAATQPDGGAIQPNSHRHTISNTSNNIPARYSSLRGQPQSANPQNEERGRDNLEYDVPPRKDSLPQNRHDQNADVNQQNTMPQMYGGPRESAAVGEDGRYMTALPQPSESKDLGTEIDQALADLTVNERSHTGATSGNTTTNSVPQSVTDQLRTPANFDLKNSERTYIDTQWREAVTQEDVYHERTEIIQEAITRDIHIHHYYTYVQPIKVVEVLPAKHYVIDEATGHKVEIPAPAGFELPLDMRPRTEDTSMIKGWERHYLVNDQYPNGISEPPPMSRPAGDGHHQGNSYTIGTL